MLVLPLPVMPCNSFVGVVVLSRDFRACFWAGFNAMAGKSSLTVLSGHRSSGPSSRAGSLSVLPVGRTNPRVALFSADLLLLFLPKPWGKNIFAAKGSGTR